jgi:predicted SPOUT superfamily RNA methylase MTH1
MNNPLKKIRKLKQATRTKKKIQISKEKKIETLPEISNTLKNNLKEREDKCIKMVIEDEEEMDFNNKINDTNFHKNEEKLFNTKKRKKEINQNKNNEEEYIEEDNEIVEEDENELEAEEDEDDENENEDSGEENNEEESNESETDDDLKNKNIEEESLNEEEQFEGKIKNNLINENVDIDIDISSNIEAEEKKENILIKRIICIPDTILQKVQTMELRNHLIGQLARILCMYKINEIIILKDHSYKQKFNELTPAEYMIKILQYLETPQYLRKRIFPISANLKHVGLIMPLECHHHLLQDHIFEYREGVVLKRPFKNESGSWVDIGLKKDCKIETSIQPGTRVSVKIENYLETNPKAYKGIVVSPNSIQKQTNYFWGYNVEYAYTFSDVFKQLNNSLNILIDSEAEINFDISQKTKIKDKIRKEKFEEIFIFFSGESLTYLHENDEVTKMQISSIKNKFHFQFNPYSDVFGFNNIYLDEQIFYYSNEIFN